MNRTKQEIEFLENQRRLIDERLEKLRKEILNDNREKDLTDYDQKPK